MASPADEEHRRALADRLRQLRQSGFGQPLNRKELGIFLGEVMRRPQGAYGARRISDFENPNALSPPPVDVLRGYAQIFGRRGAPPYDGPPSAEEQQAIGALDDELVALRGAIHAPPASPPSGGAWRWIAVGGWRWISVGALVVVAVAAFGRALIFDDKPSPPTPPPPTPCVRDLDNRPPDGAAVVCARDVRLRQAPGAAAIDTLTSGDRFEIDRYSPTGVWVQGTARFKNGRELEGWIEAGWFCPIDGSDSPATASNTATP